MKFKLKTSAKHRFGVQNQLPYSGLTTFDKEGNAEVDLVNEQELEKLLETITDLSLVVPEKKKEEVKKPGENKKPADPITSGVDPLQKQVVENTLGKAAEEKNDIGGGAKEEDDFFAKATIDELKDLASTLPKEEWEKLDEAGLRAYLKSKV